jgi:hypothetical protein
MSDPTTTTNYTLYHYFLEAGRAAAVDCRDAVDDLVDGAGGAHGHGERLHAGLEKTWFFILKKNSPAGSFVFFGVFWIFLGFLYICPEERIFRFFSVSRILLGASSL